MQPACRFQLEIFRREFLIHYYQGSAFELNKNIMSGMRTTVHLQSPRLIHTNYIYSTLITFHYPGTWIHMFNFNCRAQSGAQRAATPIRTHTEGGWLEGRSKAMIKLLEAPVVLSSPVREDVLYRGHS